MPLSICLCVHIKQEWGERIPNVSPWLRSCVVISKSYILTFHILLLWEKKKGQMQKWKEKSASNLLGKCIRFHHYLALWLLLKLGSVVWFSGLFPGSARPPTCFIAAIDVCTAACFISEPGRFCSTEKEKLISSWDAWKQDRKLHQTLFLLILIAATLNGFI